MNRSNTKLIPWRQAGQLLIPSGASNTTLQLGHSTSYVSCSNCVLAVSLVSVSKLFITSAPKLSVAIYSPPIIPYITTYGIGWQQMDDYMNQIQISNYNSNQIRTVVSGKEELSHATIGE